MITIGFRFDGIHSDELGLNVQAIQDPILPPTRDYEVQVPGMDGAYDFGCDFDKRPITVRLCYKEESRQNIRLLSRRIAAWINPKKGQRTLVLDDEPEKQYKARILGTIDAEYLLNPYMELPLTFVAFDPFAIMSYDVILESDVLLNSDIRLDGDEYKFSVDPITGPMSRTIVNPGTYPINPIIRIGGTFTELRLSTNMKTLICRGEGNLEIDCQKMTATKDGQNAINLIDGDFLALEPGENAITVDGNGLNCSIVFYFAGKFL
ncbi:phage tail family protein [Heliobacterium chlorum]|uniref:Phage tail family protein n=1 Tax=Heliobacterium chlorum TaxID=2698 RepID=A0ABR7T042_HELCL|nr:phage tail family protein [Heliobacterium chlorum]